MASIPLDAAGQVAYYDRVTGSHDFTIEVDVLDMNERLLGQVDFLDGQVNFQRQARDSTTGSPAPPTSSSPTPTTCCT